MVEAFLGRKARWSACKRRKLRWSRGSSFHHLSNATRPRIGHTNVGPSHTQLLALRFRSVGGKFAEYEV